jgi:tetratricopeptide (TPR) repeat protein
MVADWVVVELEPAGAARSGLPPRLAVPREVAERSDPIERVRAAEWAKVFVAGHSDHELAPTLLAMSTAEPYRRLGERLIREERFDEAAPALARAIELTPFDAASRFNLAVALRRADEPELALSALEEAEWAYGGESAYHVLLGRVWEALDERMRAVLAYERALELAPGDGFVLERLEHLGALMRIQGPDGEVFWLTPGDFERVMRHEIASAGNDADQLVLLGDRLLGGGHVALAASAAELALAGSEDLPGAWALAGLTRQALGRDLQARDALARAAALDPSNIAVARALVLREDDPDGDLPRAHAEVQRRPGSAAAWIILGDYLAAAAQPNEALGAYAHAFDLDPALTGAEHAREALRVLG